MSAKDNPKTKLDFLVYRGHKINPFSEVKTKPLTAQVYEAIHSDIKRDCKTLGITMGDFVGAAVIEASYSLFAYASDKRLEETNAKKAEELAAKMPESLAVAEEIKAHIAAKKEGQEGAGE